MTEIGARVGAILSAERSSVSSYREIADRCRFRLLGYAETPGGPEDVERLLAELDHYVELYIRSERFLLKRLALADPSDETVERVWSE